MTIILLLVSAVLLSLLVPGGPFENRDFSDINTEILLGFNIFLTTLALGSFLLPVVIWKGPRVSLIISALAGLSYFVVYAIDLAKIFPQSPTAMSACLFWIEVIGLVISLPLMSFSIRAYRETNQSSEKHFSIDRSKLFLIMSVMTAIALVIIVFATRSAMMPTH